MKRSDSMGNLDYIVEHGEEVRQIFSLSRSFKEDLSLDITNSLFDRTVSCSKSEGSLLPESPTTSNFSQNILLLSSAGLLLRSDRASAQLPMLPSQATSHPHNHLSFHTGELNGYGNDGRRCVSSNASSSTRSMPSNGDDADGKARSLPSLQHSDVDESETQQGSGGNEGGGKGKGNEKEGDETKGCVRAVRGRRSDLEDSANSPDSAVSSGGGMTVTEEEDDEDARAGKWLGGDGEERSSANSEQYGTPTEVIGAERPTGDDGWLTPVDVPSMDDTRIKMLRMDDEQKGRRVDETANDDENKFAVEDLGSSMKSLSKSLPGLQEITWDLQKRRNQRKSIGDLSDTACNERENSEYAYTQLFEMPCVNSTEFSYDVSNAALHISGLARVESRSSDSVSDESIGYEALHASISAASSVVSVPESLKLPHSAEKKFMGARDIDGDGSSLLADECEEVDSVEDLMLRSTISTHPLDDSANFRVLENTSGPYLRSPVPSYESSYSRCEDTVSCSSSHELASILEHHDEHDEAQPSSSSDIAVLNLEGRKIYSDDANSASFYGISMEGPCSEVDVSADMSADFSTDDTSDVLHCRSQSEYSDLSFPYRKPPEVLQHEETQELEGEINDNVSLRKTDGRGAISYSTRCKSQLVLTKIEKDWEQSPLEDSKVLSTSTPSVNDTPPVNSQRSIDKPEILVKGDDMVRKMEHGCGADFPSMMKVERNPSKTWAEVMPTAFGAHEVFSGMQRPSHTSPKTNAVADITAKPTKKFRLEKKSSKKSLLFDFIPKRKKPETHHRPCILTDADRRSTVSDEPVSQSEGLPDVLLKALRDRPTTIGATDGRFISEHLADSKKLFRPDVNKKRWSSLKLWSEEPSSWTARYPNEKVTKQERKKQDIINELYTTEKHYCQVLVILQQVYQEGLRYMAILSPAKLGDLIPTVLDTLLDFHLSLLRKLREKIMEKPVVDSISEIIYTHFEKSEMFEGAVNAYTEICSRKDSCGRLYEEFRAKYSDFRRFFDDYEKGQHKDRSFKMCLLIIAQRLTKYPVLLEQLAKVESKDYREETQRAHKAVKSFAMHVDTELAKLELNKRWDKIRKQIDRSSIGRLNKDDRFTYDDLIVKGAEDRREILCIGGAICHNSEQKAEDGREVVLVLFDDILVLLSSPNGRGGKYTFCDRGPDRCSVIPLRSLIIRRMPRNRSLFLVVAVDPFFDLIVVTFNSNNDLVQWKGAIEEAKENAPNYVRRARSKSSEALMKTGEDSDEVQFNIEMERWENSLWQHFENRKNQEYELAKYIEKRIKWFEELKQHIVKIPVKSRHDGHRTVVPDKIKTLVKERYSELRKAKKLSLSKAVLAAEKVLESDFLSFFDDAHDASITSSDSNPPSDQSESDESRPKLPRRIQTFHGTGGRQRESGIRRHTTEPKLGDKHSSQSGENVEAEEDEIQSEIHKLPLWLSSRARKAAECLIRDNVRLKIENNQLKCQIALEEIHVASLKTRRLTTRPTTLEELRKKQQELQDEELSFRSQCELQRHEISLREEFIRKKEEELKAREEQLQQQWQTFQERSYAPIETVSYHRPIGLTNRPLVANSLLPGSVHQDRSPLQSTTISSCSSVSPSRSFPKSMSSSSMPLHLAEKTSKVPRTRRI